jgi:hypothetical protein
MKNILTTGLLALMMMAGAANAQRISDVSKQDPAFSAISKSVKQGYFSLNSDDQFQGQSGVNRKEMALILEKLTADSDQSAGLSRVDVQEIKSAVKTFKQYFSQYESTNTANASVMVRIENEQKVINHDLSSINESLKKEIQELKKENEIQQTYLWYGIISAALFGAIIK